MSGQPKPPRARAGRAARLVMIFLCWWVAQSAANTANLAPQVKAAMLYKFLSYVEWPQETFPTPSSPYVIAVAASSEIADELTQVTVNRLVQERPIIIKKVTSKSDLSGVHLLFVGHHATAAQRRRMVEGIGQQAVVLVTEDAEGLGSDSIINFRLVNDRIGFDVSLVNATARRLKLSARLLAVATSVQKGGG